MKIVFYTLPYVENDQADLLVLLEQVKQRPKEVERS